MIERSKESLMKLNDKLQPEDSILARPQIPTPYEFENKYPETQQRVNKTSNEFVVNLSVSGTLTLPVSSGTVSLPNEGQFALQTQGGSVVLIARSGGTLFKFSPSGTL